jgi:hypothetical protein
MRALVLSLTAGALAFGGLMFAPATAQAGHVEHHRHVLVHRNVHYSWYWYNYHWVRRCR